MIRTPWTRTPAGARRARRPRQFRRVTTTGPAAVDVAWARYADLRLWPRWAPQIRAVEAPRRRLRAGLRGVVHAPLGLRVPFVVEEVDDDARTWRWTVRVAGTAVSMTHDLTATPRGTRAGLTVHGPAIVALAYRLPARVALRRLCRAHL